MYTPIFRRDFPQLGARAGKEERADERRQHDAIVAQAWGDCMRTVI